MADIGCKPIDWDTEHLRLAIEAAGVTLWSWNVDTDKLTMDSRAFDLWGVPRSATVTFEDLSAHIHPAFFVPTGGCRVLLLEGGRLWIAPSQVEEVLAA